MGPLAGIKVIELAGLGAGPFAGMMLADMGAEVVCVERTTDTEQDSQPDCSRRGKQSIALDLKNERGVAALLRLAGRADVLFESFRPGVAERLGFGPDVCLERNPRLVYGRMTGWGQTGPLAAVAGHDINYIALTGALHATGRAGEKPVPPLNLVGDYGGGAMFLVTGILAALLEAQRSGRGQVVDAAMTDGSAVLMALFHSLHAMGRWSSQRGANLLDSGAPFYDVYETRDGRFVAVGALEPQFFELLLEKTGLPLDEAGDRHDTARWPALKSRLAGIFRSKTRDEWCELLEGTDACFAPVLDFLEAPKHPHNVARQTYVDVDGMTQPAPAPRFSRTASRVRFGARARGTDTAAVLADWGFSDEEIARLRDGGALG